MSDARFIATKGIDSIFASCWRNWWRRYVHLNPVRVENLGLGKAQGRRDRLGLGEKASAEQVQERIEILRAYRWSSYRAYVGLEKAPAWLTCQSLRELVGGKPGAKQRQAYREHVESAVRQGLPESPWEKVTARVLLGGAESPGPAAHLLTGSHGA